MAAALRPETYLAVAQNLKELGLRRFWSMSNDFPGQAIWDP